MSQNIKKLKGKIFIFGKKISQCRKKLKGGTLWDFATSILSQNSKKIEGGPFEEKIFSGKKVSQCRKKLEGGTFWSRRVWYVTRKNRKNFLVQFARPNSAIIFCRTILVSSCGLKKSHYNSRVSLQEAPTKNCQKMSAMMNPTI